MILITDFKAAIEAEELETENENRPQRNTNTHNTAQKLLNNYKTVHETLLYW